MIKNIMIVSLIFASLLLVNSSVYSGEYRGTIDYIQKTSRLWGMSACVVNEDGSITLIDARDKGYGNGLWIPDGKGGRLEKVILKPGESCGLIDGHHISIAYKFIGLEGGKIAIEVIDIFNAKSFGGEIKEERGKVLVNPYREDQ